MRYPEAFTKYNLHCAVLYVAVTGEEGENGVGSCFHLGEGLFVTARHVVEGKQVQQIGRHDLSLKTAHDGGKTTTHGSFLYKGRTDVTYHPDERVDVALIQLTEDVRPKFPPRNIHPLLILDNSRDTLTEGEILGEEVFVLGYPPIPFNGDPDGNPNIVLLRGEIASVFFHRYAKRRHYVISGMARGGFSGGPMLSTNGDVLGVIVESLCDASSSQTSITELGFLAAISTQAIAETLEAASRNPKEYLRVR
jgi:S1-C subfamily serine protease